MYQYGQDIVIGHWWLVVLSTEFDRQLWRCYDVIGSTASQTQLLQKLKLGLHG